MTELSAEQALIEKIAKEGVNLRNYPNLWRLLNRRRKDSWRNWAKTAILPLIIEAFPELAKARGWKSPEEVVEFIVSHKRSYYAKPDGTIISITSAEWTEQEWESLTKGVAL